MYKVSTKTKQRKYEKNVTYVLKNPSHLKNPKKILIYILLNPKTTEIS